MNQNEGVAKFAAIKGAPQSVRYLNELRALDVLFREGAMSRADLARALGLNRSTTGNIIGSLMAQALVVERPRARQPGVPVRTGRPGIDIELDPKGAVFIGAEIEVDRLTAVAIDLCGKITRRKSVAFHAARQDPATGAEGVAKLVNSLIRSSPDSARVKGVCVAVPALVERGNVRHGLLLGWRDAPLADLIKKHVPANLPIAIENDANAFAIAETYTGASRNSETVAFLVVDSGAGGAIVSGGRLFRGGGMAGEFGHLSMGGSGYAIERSRTGLLENYIGKDAVLARYATRGGPEGVSLRDFFTALEHGETAAVDTANDWAKWLAQGLLHIVNIINPDLVIIGGSVGGVYPFVAPTVDAILRTELPDEFQMPKIELSQFGAEGPALGAALLLHQRMFSVDERAFYPDGGARGLFRMASV